MRGDNLTDEPSMPDKAALPCCFAVGWDKKGVEHQALCQKFLSLFYRYIEQIDFAGSESVFHADIEAGQLKDLFNEHEQCSISLRVRLSPELPAEIWRINCSKASKATNFELCLPMHEPQIESPPHALLALQPAAEFNMNSRNLLINAPVFINRQSQSVTSLHPAFFHTLADIASQNRPFSSASLYSEDKVIFSWAGNNKKSSGSGDSLLAHKDIPGLLFPGDNNDGGDDLISAPLKFSRNIESRESSSFVTTFLTRLAGLATPEEIIACISDDIGLHKFVGAPVQISIKTDSFSDISFMTHPPESLAMAVMAAPEYACLIVNPDLAKQHFRELLLHGISHLLLRHIIPGDTCAHWDTIETATGLKTWRNWDKQTDELLAFLKSDYKPQSAEECSVADRAGLGLWRMIDEMVGGMQVLHQQAIAYQQAAYQRQAAQRLVTQLEELGGAMLCDGVGLGKTYVATTIIVHYSNQWLDRLSKKESAAGNPFRISIIAPNSIVSTWKREALPPMARHNVALRNIRVISHTRLSRLSGSSEVLFGSKTATISDFEHLMLSDLVIVDEAHNFRSTDARRTMVLRDILRVRPRKDIARKVLLLTATPINNSLEDLAQETSLLFFNPIWLSEALTAETYRKHAVNIIGERVANARAGKIKGGDIAAYLVHGNENQRFSNARNFRRDLPLGNIRLLDQYFKEQEKKLKQAQERIKTASLNGEQLTEEDLHLRIADELLDRVVVQRSRELCRQIEKQQNSKVELLFRKDPAEPERLFYSDEYDGISDVLKGFLQLFQNAEEQAKPGQSFLTLKIYMWADVREGIRDADEMSSVVGLQRMLVLKRLESTPVSFLITLLRLINLHAFRLKHLLNICKKAGSKLEKKLQNEIDLLLDSFETSELKKISLLASEKERSQKPANFIETLSEAHKKTKKIGDDDAQTISQGILALDVDSEEDAEAAYASPLNEQLDRLWALKDYLLSDFSILLKVTPKLADIIFGRYDLAARPGAFAAAGGAVDWPIDSRWGLRMVTDSKLRELFRRLLLARQQRLKVIVFSQFTDSLNYIYSVIKACHNFSGQDWQLLIRGLGVPDTRPDDIRQLLAVIQMVTGDTEDRDAVVNSFAPYYRIGPFAPSDTGVELENSALLADWQQSWRQAMQKPVEVLFASDVLAEGVNLQDAAMLINFDIHWNPVRMIQRSGRVDRRLNPAIEKPPDYPELANLAKQCGCKVPAYFWHNTSLEAPIIVNMLLPDELENELLLRERIAVKTLAIDFTLGLSQGTGAEADWLAKYTYHGVSSLNSFQRDRAIEQLAGFHEKLLARFNKYGISTGWAENANGWFRVPGANDVSPLITRITITGNSGRAETRRRYLLPFRHNEMLCMLVSPYDGHASGNLNENIILLDGKNWPPDAIQAPLNTPGDSQPLAADDLLTAVRWYFEYVEDLLLLGDAYLPLAQQSIPAINTGYFADINELAYLDFNGYYFFQYPMRKVKP